MTTRKSPQDRKAEIIGTTLDLAFEVGPDHVTTGMIAARLGMTQPAIYKHYQKKDDIWLAASEKLCDRIHENIRQSGLAAQPAHDKLRHLILGHLRLVTDVPALPEIMVARDATGSLTDARRHIQAAMTDFRTALTMSFEQARIAGKFRADLHTEDAVMLLFGIIQSLVLRLIVGRDPTLLVQDGERLLALQLTLFSNQGTLR